MSREYLERVIKEEIEGLSSVPRDLLAFALETTIRGGEDAPLFGDAFIEGLTDWKKDCENFIEKEIENVLKMTIEYEEEVVSTLPREKVEKFKRMLRRLKTERNYMAAWESYFRETPPQGIDLELAGRLMGCLCNLKRFNDARRIMRVLREVLPILAEYEEEEEY